MKKYPRRKDCLSFLQLSKRNCLGGGLGGGGGGGGEVDASRNISRLANIDTSANHQWLAYTPSLLIV